MILAHVFLPIILCVICEPPHISAESLNGDANDEASAFNDSTPPKPFAKSTATNEQLDRYRRFVAKSLASLPDSCQAHDFFQYLKNDLVNDFIDDETLSKPPNVEHNHQQQYIDTLISLIQSKPDAEPSFLPAAAIDEDRAAAYYILLTSMFLQDDQFDDILGAQLHDKCCRNDANFRASPICLDEPIADKRGYKGGARRVRFHSWGGKRSENARPRNNGRLTLPIEYIKDAGRTKIVSRAPFRPWGGKRSGAA